MLLLHADYNTYCTYTLQFACGLPFNWFSPWKGIQGDVPPSPAAWHVSLANHFHRQSRETHSDRVAGWSEADRDQSWHRFQSRTEVNNVFDLLLLKKVKVRFGVFDPRSLHKGDPSSFLLQGMFTFLVIEIKVLYKKKCKKFKLTKWQCKNKM